MRTLIIGDIHGAYRAMLQVLERAKFNPSIDILVGLGDYVDGWPESFEVVEYLRNLPHFIGIRGNHDSWAIPWLREDYAQYIWTSQGGDATITSYDRARTEQKAEHYTFLRNLPSYLVIGNNYAVVIHGGCMDESYLSSLEYLSPDTLMWDRDLFYSFYNYKQINKPVNVLPFANVFIGHTQTGNKITGLDPFEYCGLYNLDQGAGWNGKLTVMDAYTKEWWQSDLVPTLYPEVKGRG
jgi:serine/threonine protein phosphatase 1